MPPSILYGGEITTSNYPRNYNNNETDTITIPYYPNQNERIKIVFNAFRLEPKAISSGKCDYDFVRITDAISGAVLLPKRCGDEIPTVELSTSSSVKVRFVTDGSNTDRGYNFTWHRVKDGDITNLPTTPEPSDPEPLRCAGAITDTECCSSGNQCGEGQGDCDTDEDCMGDLR